MYLEIFWSDACKFDRTKINFFLQKMANRLMQGDFRYGPISKEAKYLTRIQLELKAYKVTGNAEHLINVANYALLEEIAPENLKFHFDNTVKSATRGKI